jgi:Mannosyl-glycoprotein endo-beta-N-acetylglucosaminidase
MRKFLITTILVWTLALTMFAAAKPKNDYITRFTEIALREKEMYNILASISMAQAILESSWGEGTLAQSNNHFGIKCHNDWTGATFSLKDDDYDAQGVLKESCFRAYETPEESWRDHSIFLQKPRYQALYDYGTNYRSWAFGLKAAGYATDSLYAQKLIGIIERYELYRLDGLTAPIPAPEVLDMDNAPSAEPIKAKKIQPSKPSKIDDENLLPEITPDNEIRFDEKTIEQEETQKPNATKIPLNYMRGQGMKKLENLFNNLKKNVQSATQNKENKRNSDELDEITPEILQQKGEDKRSSSSRMVSEKVVALR